MPEIKNTFLKSKMNKDLDSRLIPNGEYRDAQNLSISKSEGADVGSLENILGNTIISDLKNKIKTLEAEKLQEYWTGSTVTPTEIQTSQLEIIGYYSAVSIDTLFLFITDYRDSSNDRLSNFAYNDISTSPPGPQFVAKGAMCYIVQFNLISNESRVLVGGSFLNFSKTHPILNVNLLEDLLFWTDNRNQPRKINIKKAALTGSFNGSWETWSGSRTNNPYYYNEDHISVAKFAPYECFKFINSSNENTLISNSEEFLPAHIVTSANNSPGVGGSTLEITGQYLLSGNNPDIVGDNVSPYSSADRLTVYIDGNYYNYLISSVSYSSPTTSITLTEAFNGPSNPGFTTSITPSNNVILISRKNPDYSSSYKGDINLLKDKFPKFSYRFKYDDGEYSLMAPFTQAAFVPKQFGYFIDNDEDITLQSGNVKFMENRVDQVKLNLTLPYNGNEMKDSLKVDQLQILVKNSDELAVRVVEDVDVSRLGTGTSYEYNYLSSKAVKTLPEADLIRVHDKIPVRALTQEIISNRVVYGNYLDKHSSPDTINYELNYISKNISNSNDPNTGLPGNVVARELPNHTLKQNRSYQVGIVLIDRYGRASNVILNNSEELVFGKNSTIYADYISEKNPAFTQFFGKQLDLTLRTPLSNSISNKPNYPGLYSSTNPLGYYSYRIVVKQQEQEYYNVYTPGALAGELIWDTVVSNASDLEVYDDSTTPPSGVTANIQDYLPSFHNKNRITLLNLFGDNINKIPRELQEVSGNDTTFDSRVLLYNRVNPLYSSTIGSYNTQSNVSKQGEKVVSIEPFRELGSWTTTKGVLFPYSEPDKKHDIPQPFYPYFVTSDYQNPPEYEYNFHDIFFNASANPFIAKIETDFKIGATPAYTTIPVNSATQANITAAKYKIERAWQDLGVFETEPTKSALDIYFESSTSGLIEDFNDSSEDAVPGGIKDSSNNQTVLGQNINYIHDESLVASVSNPTDVTQELFLTDLSGGVINSNFSVDLQSVTDGNNDPVSGFIAVMVTTSSFKIQVTSNKIFTYNSPVIDNYTFNLGFTDTSDPSSPLWTGSYPIQLSNCQMQNVAPIWLNQPATQHDFFSSENSVFSILSSDVTNGSSSISLADKLNGLQFNITEQKTVTGNFPGDYYKLAPGGSGVGDPSAIAVLVAGNDFQSLSTFDNVRLKIQLTDAVASNQRVVVSSPNPTAPGANSGITVDSVLIQITKQV